MHACTRMRPAPHRDERGFTLIELMIVVLIVGLLASIGMANFYSLQEKAKYADCVSNQRHIHEASFIYSADNNLTGNQAINVSNLVASELINREVGECPSSGTVDFDDYDVNLVNGDAIQITCSIRGADHQYETQR